MGRSNETRRQQNGWNDCFGKPGVGGGDGSHGTVLTINIPKGTRASAITRK